MSIIQLDEAKCVRCGICVAECPALVMKMSEKGPEEISPKSCIACGHCVAVCPHAAIDNRLTPLVQQISVEAPAFDKEAAGRFLRSRRSIRTYQKKPVPREVLKELVDMARMAPTGSNSQGISYIVVEDRKILDAAVAAIVDWLETTPLGQSYFKSMIVAYRQNGTDTILRGAPHLVLALADQDFRWARENSIFSLAYLELYAPVLGVGSCWAGIFEACAFSGYEPLLKLFNIPEGKKITGAVMAGYPLFRYQRLPERNPLEVTFI